MRITRFVSVIPTVPIRRSDRDARGSTTDRARAPPLNMAGVPGSRLDAGRDDDGDRGNHRHPGGTLRLPQVRSAGRPFCRHVLVARSAPGMPLRFEERDADAGSSSRRPRSRTARLVTAGAEPSRPGAGSPRSAPPIATTSSASGPSSPAAGKSVRRPVEVDRRDDLAGRVRDRCRDRRDPLVELLERPGVAVAPDRPHPLEQRVGGHQRARR